MVMDSAAVGCQVDDVRTKELKGVPRGSNVRQVQVWTASLRDYQKCIGQSDITHPLHRYGGKMETVHMSPPSCHTMQICEELLRKINTEIR